VSHPTIGTDNLTSQIDTMTSQVFISSLKESSKFVSCVDIEDKDSRLEQSDEIKAEEGNTDPIHGGQVELGHKAEAPSDDGKLRQLENDPTFFQYFFGCLPCVGNPKA